jgi:hypothetical protein
MGQPGRTREGNVDFPSRNGPPSPFLRGEKLSVFVHVNIYGRVFSLISSLLGPTGNLSPLEI